MRFLIPFLLIPFIGFVQLSPSFIVKANLSYSQLESSGDGLFGFEKGGKFGYMDKNENIVIPAIYSFESETLKTIPSFTKGHVRLKKDGKYGILDRTGKITIPFEHDNLNIYPLLVNHVSYSRKVDGKTLYGMVTLQNKPVLPAEYEQLVGDGNMIVFKINGKFGLADGTGKELIPAGFTSLTAFAAEGVLLAEKDGKYGIADTKGNWLFEKQKSVYTLLGAAQGMIRCKVNGKYGFLDRKGNEVIITRYDDATDFNSIGLSKVGQKKTGSTYSSHYGFIDKSGKEVIPIKYESLGTFSNGLAIAKDPETNRYGFLDKTGKWIIKPVYLDGLNFDDFGGCWVKMTDARYHYIDKTGKDFGIVDSTSYRNFGKDGYAVRSHLDYPYVLIDKTGKNIQKLDDCDAIYTFSEGIAGYRCKSNSKYGFIDVNGKTIGSCMYDGFSGFADGVARIEMKVSGKTKYGYINSKGETILAAEYDDLRVFRNGWGLMKKDGNYFFVDKNGTTKEGPRKYDNLVEFRSGFAVGTVNGAKDEPNTYYYINTSLKEEFNITAYQGYQFWENVAVVNKDTVYSLMNKKGEVFKRLNGIDQLKFCSDGMLAVKEKARPDDPVGRGKWGYMDDRGNMVITAKYDSCDVFKNGYARFRMGSKWGLVDKTGKEVVEAKYENVFSGENGVFIFYDNSWGIMDKTGKITVPARFYSITTFEKDRALARLGKGFTIVRSPLAK